MKEVPGAFDKDKAETFRLDFSVYESSKEGSAEAPVLMYARSGFTFRVTLDLLANEINIELVASPDEALESHSKTLAHEVAKLAAEELDERRELYGETHFA